MKDPVSRRSRGFGFITFQDVESVDKVLENEPHNIDSRKVEAKRAVPRAEFREGLPSGVVATSKVGNVDSLLDSNVSGQKGVISSKSALSSCGTKSSFKSFNICEVNGNEKSSSNEVLKIPNEDTNSFCKIFVGGLHYDTRDGDFRAYFEKYGRVISAEVMFNRETRKSRGFGFIIFDQEEVDILISMKISFICTVNTPQKFFCSLLTLCVK